MKKIMADSLVAGTNATTFANQVHETIGNFQDKGWAIEVQYQTTSVFKDNNEVMYSAFIIAREGE